MSLIGRGPHTLRVQPKRETGRDVYGVVVVGDDGDPVDWRCSVQPLSSQESVEAGLQVNTGYRAIGPLGFPGGVRADILWVERNIQFTLVGFPADRTTGRRTRHTTVTLQQIGGSNV